MKFRLLLLIALFVLLNVNNSFSFQFTPGNIIIVRVGEQSNNIPLTSAAKVFLDEYSPDGNFIKSIELPSKISGNNLRLTLDRINPNNGFISTSSDGRYLILSGYDLNPGTPNITNFSNVKKTIALIDLFGNVNSSFYISERDATDNVYSIVSDAGKNFWFSSTGSTKSSGVKFTSVIDNGLSIPFISSGINSRIIKLVNDNIYVSGFLNDFKGIFKIGNGLPVTGNQSSSFYAGGNSPNSISPLDFAINEQENILYIADDRQISNGGGIQKWVNENGTWVFKYVLKNGLSNGVRSINVDWSGNSPVIFAITSESTQNKFVKIIDENISSQFTVIKTSQINTIYKSITYAPNSGVISTNIVLNSGNYKNLIINNSEVSVSGDLTISGRLELKENSKFITGNHKLIFENSSELIESFPNKMIIGTALMLPRYIGINGLNEFLGISINAGSDNLGSVSIKRTTGYSGIVYTGTGSGIAANWEINSDFAPLNGRNITFNFSSDFDNGKNMQFAEVWQQNGNGWIKIGSTENISGSNPRTITKNVNSFSKFTITDTDNLLPVELDGFVASTIKNEVILDWVTSNELNNSHFVVERVNLKGNINKYNAVYTELGTVQGSGQSTEIKRYRYTDKNVPTGKYAYRLKQVDYNGNFQFYVMEADVIVGTPSKFRISQNYPNPFNPSTKINFEIANDSRVSLKIYDINGKEVATLVNDNLQSGYYTQEFNATGLASGIYFAKIIAGEFVDVKKLTLLK